MSRKPQNAVTPVFNDAKVESYSGYQGEETPRALVLDGKRFEVASVLSRKRALDSETGLRREVWKCRLNDGREVLVEKFDSGVWRVSPAS